MLSCIFFDPEYIHIWFRVEYYVRFGSNGDLIYLIQLCVIHVQAHTERPNVKWCGEWPKIRLLFDNIMKLDFTICTGFSFVLLIIVTTMPQILYCGTQSKFKYFYFHSLSVFSFRSPFIVDRKYYIFFGSCTGFPLPL